jgi:hypothetical protein
VISKGQRLGVRALSAVIAEHQAKAACSGFEPLGERVDESLLRGSVEDREGYFLEGTGEFDGQHPMEKFGD